MCVGECMTGFIIKCLIMLHSDCDDVIAEPSLTHLHLANHSSPLAITIIIIIISCFRYPLGPHIHRGAAALLKPALRSQDGLQRNPAASDVQTWKSWAASGVEICSTAPMGVSVFLNPGVAEVRMAVSQLKQSRGMFLRGRDVKNPDNSTIIKYLWKPRHDGERTVRLDQSVCYQTDKMHDHHNRQTASIKGPQLSHNYTPTLPPVCVVCCETSAHRNCL